MSEAVQRDTQPDAAPAAGARISVQRDTQPDAAPAAGARISVQRDTQPDAAASAGARVSVRRASGADAAALAGLRWRRATEERGYTGTDRAGFLAAFAAWLAEHSATHLPFVAEAAGEVIGMAWLMTIDRVPTAESQTRQSGDVQSVFVVPELRNSGVGALLIREVLAEAERLGLERVTVHSTGRAVPFYERIGFGSDRTFLSWQPDR